MELEAVESAPTPAEHRLHDNVPDLTGGDDPAETPGDEASPVGSRAG